jgi:hypothetical protein
MWFVLGTLAFLVLGNAFGPGISARLAARKRRRYESGRATKLPVWLRSSALAFPRHWRIGTVRTDGDPLRHRVWHRMSPPYPLVGLTLVRRGEDVVANASEPLTVLHLRDPNGALVEMGVHPDNADLLVRVLRTERQGVAPAPRPDRLPLLTMVVAVPAVVWLLAWVYFAIAGQVLDATVLANDGAGTCRVEWVEAGRTYADEADCGDDATPGATMRIIAIPPPFRGLAVDVPHTLYWVPGIFLAGVAPLGAAAALRAIRRRRPVPTGAGTAVVAETGVARLERHELRYAAIAATVERRAEVEGWREVTAAGWQRMVRSPVRRLVLRWVGRTVWPLFVLFFAALFGWTSASTALRLDASASRTAEATVVTTNGFVPPVPYDVTVSFDVNGVVREVQVASTVRYGAGRHVTIEYGAGNPHVARLVGPDDGVGRGLFVGGVLGAVALTLLLWRLTVAARVLRTFRRRRREPGADLRYAIARDGAGDFVLLLFPLGGDPRPDAGVLLERVPPDVPVSGTALVRGPVEEDGLVVVEVDGRVLYPDSGVMLAGAEIVHLLVNGDPPDEYGDDEGWGEPE